MYKILLIIEKEYGLDEIHFSKVKIRDHKKKFRENVTK